MVHAQLAVEDIIQQHLAPLVKKIDEDALYAESYLLELGKNGYFRSSGKDRATLLQDEASLVEQTAAVCMTTAFCLWCHLAALTYIRNTDNEALRNTYLPALENGELLGATGLSNPMKFYSGLEKLHLNAERVEGGYIVNGVLGAVSNIAEDHVFGGIAQLPNDTEVMFLVDLRKHSVPLKEKANFIGINGSATYSCRFDDVFIADEFVLAHETKNFVGTIRPAFVIYQIPLGLGVMDAAITTIDKVKAKQNGCNEYLQTQSCDLQQKRNALQARVTELTHGAPLVDICQARLDAVHATLEATQASMLHTGAAGYVAGSKPSRLLRESYFFASLTPTVRHLEKLIQTH
ncbi:MAG: acyl-CoA dehydrogenase family protein [Caryophanon sp.]|nr:acyl-CoA dehydrogenase family protein [Caryophanon sp.]